MTRTTDKAKAIHAPGQGSLPFLFDLPLGRRVFREMVAPVPAQGPVASLVVEAPATETAPIALMLATAMRLVEGARQGEVGEWLRSRLAEAGKSHLFDAGADYDALYRSVMVKELTRAGLWGIDVERKRDIFMHALALSSTPSTLALFDPEKVRGLERRFKTKVTHPYANQNDAQIMLGYLLQNFRFKVKSGILSHNLHRRDEHVLIGDRMGGEDERSQEEVLSTLRGETAEGADRAYEAGRLLADLSLHICTDCDEGTAAALLGLMGGLMREMSNREIAESFGWSTSQVSVLYRRLKEVTLDYARLHRNADLMRAMKAIMDKGRAVHA